MEPVDIPMPGKTFLTKKELSSQIGKEVLGRHLSEVLGQAGAESVEVDFGFVEAQRVIEQAFTFPGNENNWGDFYRENYDRARNHESDLYVISAVLVSRSQSLRIHGSTLARLKTIAETLTAEGGPRYDVVPDGDRTFRMSASATRSRIEGYKPFEPKYLPALAPLLARQSPPPTPAATPESTPKASVSPSASPPAFEYALVWYNHFEPNTSYKVVATDITKPELRNDGFKQFCVPLDLSHKKVISREEVAGDERFKGSREPNWWTKPPYNLPALNQRWLNIMDDERWYVLTMQPD